MDWIRTFLRIIAVCTGIVRKPIFVANYLEDHPTQETIHAGVIYIICNCGYQKWAMFRCPRYENEIIRLCLMANQQPRWTVKIDLLGRPTISPSVRQLEGSYAHLWIKKGNVEWCSDSGKPAQSFGRSGR
jgi:hypothetical protein